MAGLDADRGRRPVRQLRRRDWPEPIAAATITAAPTRNESAKDCARLFISKTLPIAIGLVHEHSFQNETERLLSNCCGGRVLIGPEGRPERLREPPHTFVEQLVVGEGEAQA